MTERMPPDDRELERYLKGDSPLSRRYRAASQETAPPELDEAILARARAELRRKPAGLNRYLAPVALAASVVLGVNLAWHVHRAAPVPGEALPPPPAQPASHDEGFVPSPPPAAVPPAALEAPAAAARPAPQPERKARAAEAPVFEERPATGESAGAMAQREAELAAREEDSMRKAETEQRAAMSRQKLPASATDSATAPAAVPASPARETAGAAAPLAEPAKIDRLIAYVGSLDGAVFIRNGKEYGPAEAASHLRYKREKAGDRVRTADDFIRLCASHSYLSGEAYLIRFADGRTRTAEDVLREELTRINAGG